MVMQDSFTSSCDIVEDVTLLLPKGCHDGQQALGKLTPRAALSTKAALAPEHDGTQGPLRRIIWKLHPLSMDKGPQGRLVLQQGATQSGTLGVFTQRPLAQEGANLHP